MKKEAPQHIDSFIPEGWEFRDEYMEKALAALHRQRMWMKWKKIGIWSSAAAITIAIGATFLHYCSSPTSQLAVVPTTETSINLPSAADTSNNAAQNSELHHPTTSPAPEANDRSTAIQADRAPQQTLDPQTANPVVDAKQGKRMASPNGTAKSSDKSSTSMAAQLNADNTKISDTPDPTSSSSNNVAARKENDPTNAVEPTSSTPPIAETLKTDAPLAPPSQSTAEEVVLLGAASAEFIPSIFNDFDMPQSPLYVGSCIAKPSRHQWHVFVGNAMWADYGRNQNNLSWQPIAGIGYNYRWKGPWSLQSQLFYSSIQNPGAVFNQMQMVYDYELLQSTTKVETKRLHYANVYLGAAYRITPTWNVYAGITAGVKITGVNTITRTDFNKVSTASKETGYVSGFQRINGGINMGIQRQLTNHVALGLQGTIGFTDVSDDAIFNQKAHQSNSQLNLILSYQFK